MKSMSGTVGVLIGFASAVVIVLATLAIFDPAEPAPVTASPRATIDRQHAEAAAETWMMLRLGSVADGHDFRDASEAAALRRALRDQPAWVTTHDRESGTWRVQAAGATWWVYDTTAVVRYVGRWTTDQPASINLVVK
jgi:hypothetical protein